MDNSGSPTPKKCDNPNHLSDPQAMPSPLNSQAVSSSNRTTRPENKTSVPLVTSKFSNVRSTQPTLDEGKEDMPPSDNPRALYVLPPPNSLPMDTLLSKLSQHKLLIEQQKQALGMADVTATLSVPGKDYEDSSNGSNPVTPISDALLANSPPTESQDGSLPSTNSSSVAEVTRLKHELDSARSQLAAMNQEIHQTRITKQTLDQAIGSSSESDFPYNGDVTEQTISKLQNAFNASTRPLGPRQGSWPQEDDARSNGSESLPSNGFNRAQGIWGNAVKSNATYNSHVGFGNWNSSTAGLFYPGAPFNPNLPPQAISPAPLQARNGFMNTRLNNFRGNQALNETASFPLDYGARRMPQPPTRPGSDMGYYNSGWQTYASSIASTDGTAGITSPLGPIGMPPVSLYPSNVSPSYTPRPTGARLSPTAAEFSVVEPMNQTPWSNQVGIANRSIIYDRSMSSSVPSMRSASTAPLQESTLHPNNPLEISSVSHTGFQLHSAGASCLQPLLNQPTSLDPITRGNMSTGDVNADFYKTSQLSQESANTYVTPVEPINYRRLLDRNMTCNWKYIVDKIVCNNDQQASIFLQQKLKVGTTEQKYEIVEAIIAQAYPLMINRFGNFLVQRCFEHGTPDQVIAIANAIRGNTLTLSMDAFGCHVVQKAFDAVPEEYKAIMVHELLRRIPETVIHRYACHVWQKLFELRWSDSPPQIMKYVNEALRGMWHEVALGETGSLVVQNIFENCLEEDKRPCINEVLASIDVIAHGQFGNWCIQHICEHGAPADRSRAIDHILRFASEYSMDQYASKVIEKCLKIGGSEFLDRYLDRVCEGRADRPRMPLIDIAGDQFGNYLIQYILTNAGAQHRELVATHVRKHMVSLRGSKYGSRVAMLCTNPVSATRPGPGTGFPQMARYHNTGAGRSGPGTFNPYR